jgi:xylulokinase
MSLVPDVRKPRRLGPAQAPRHHHRGGIEITIGVDVGTTAVKAVAVDAEGGVRARARVPVPVHVIESDSFEHDAAVAWQKAPLQAVAALGAVADAAVGFGIAACVPSLVALDDDLLPLSPGLLYGDRRGRGATGTGPAPFPRNPLDVHEGESFLSWAARRWPEARAYWPAQAVAAAALGAPPVIDIFTALSFFPVFNGFHWDPARLASLGITEDQLPSVVAEVGTPAGVLAAGSPVGNRRPAALVASGVDVVAEQVTVGLTKPGEAHVMCGATLITWAVVPDNGDVPGLWRIPHPRPGLCLLGGPSDTGGMFLGWAQRLASTRPHMNPAHPDRVPLWIPYVRGERAPLHDASLRASLHGLDLTHDAMALRRAAYEAVGFVVRRHLDLAGSTPTRIVATGGGVRDREWMQALADCTGAVVVRSTVPEGAAVGMAWLARMAAGLESSLTDAHRWFHAQRPVYPDERWMEACFRRYERFCAITADHLPPLREHDPYDAASGR